MVHWTLPSRGCNHCAGACFAGFSGASGLKVLNSGSKAVLKKLNFKGYGLEKLF